MLQEEMDESNPIIGLITYFLFQYWSLKSPEPLVPEIYVFGDSLVDSGNNNFLNTSAEANYKPYGIDFPWGVTGRFTNGKTCLDYMTELLELPYVPPYLGLSESQKAKTVTGVNYASGSGGILRESGTALGENICLDEQIKYFKKTLTEDLPKNFRTRARLSNYLTKSIFLIMIGSNDYINNYLKPANYNTSSIYTPQQFANLLVHRLQLHLLKLYMYGARKFVVFGLGALGCIPAIVNSENPRPTTTCVETANSYVIMFNERQRLMIQQLNSTLLHSTFVLGDVYSSSYTTNINPAEYGFNEVSIPCCIVGENGTSQCLPNLVPCPDRTKYFYYDAFHPTQVVTQDLAKKCFSSSSICVPINLQQLAQK